MEARPDLSLSPPSSRISPRSTHGLAEPLSRSFRVTIDQQRPNLRCLDHPEAVSGRGLISTCILICLTQPASFCETFLPRPTSSGTILLRHETGHFHFNRSRAVPLLRPGRRY